MVEAVVWDIGNVLAHWQPETYYDRLIGQERRKRLFEETGLLEVNAEIDLGLPLAEGVAALAADFPDWAVEIRCWHEDWAAMFQDPVEGSADILRALKSAGIPCFALSNFGADSLLIAKKLHPVLCEFDMEFISAHLGTAKPDPAIYAALETGTGLSGGELIFADDRSENVDAAAARGWKTHLFDNASGWLERLQAEGLLTA